MVRLGDKGRVVIPAALRAAAGLPKGADLVGRVDAEGRIVLETREAIKKRLRTLAAATRSRRNGTVVERLLVDRRADLDLDERRQRVASRGRKTRPRA